MKIFFIRISKFSEKLLEILMCIFVVFFYCIPEKAGLQRTLAPVGGEICLAAKNRKKD